MVKRKRVEAQEGASAAAAAAATGKKAKAGQTKKQGQSKAAKPSATTSSSPLPPCTIQIIAGSYDRVLHGLTATITPAATSQANKAKSSNNTATTTTNTTATSSAEAGSQQAEVEFADTFLFNAHSSAIRCLALSPPSIPEPGRGQKVMLASGSSDERINVYHLSAHPPSRRQADDAAALYAAAGAPRSIVENRRNREIGTLLHHASTVTRLAFPTRSKLVTASEDSTVSVARTRDWSVLSTIRCPVPKPHGRPSGDTAALGAQPAGVNDFALHPSMKLMISVGRGERCMRLWNLMTARKAGVLNFGRDILAAAGEGRHGLGEGRRVVWGRPGGDGGGDGGEEEEEGEEGGAGEDEFAVAFDRDLVVFGMDSTPRCTVMPDHRSKVHEISYVEVGSEGASLLAVSTEDGRILFFSTRAGDLVPSSDGAGDGKKKEKETAQLPRAKLVAQIGGKEAGVAGRIKDFTVLRAPAPGSDNLIVATGSSDGKVRIFALAAADLLARRGKGGGGSDSAASKPPQAGALLGTYETQNRITCLEAFVMIPRPEGVEDSDDEFEDVTSSDDDDDDDDDDDEEDED